MIRAEYPSAEEFRRLETRVDITLGDQVAALAARVRGLLWVAGLLGFWVAVLLVLVVLR